MNAQLVPDFDSNARAQFVPDWVSPGGGGQQYYKSLDGVVSFLGDIQYALLILRILNGGFTSSGSLDARAFMGVTLSGVAQFAGNITKGVFKQLWGALSFAGDKVSSVFKSLQGFAQFVGNVTRAYFTRQAASGILSFLGVIATVLNPIVSPIENVIKIVSCGLKKIIGGEE